jgi:FkbM family methyltransferase
MGIGAKSPAHRRALFRLFSSRYFRRRATTPDGTFVAYVSPSSSLHVLNFAKSMVHPVHARFIRDWIGPTDVVWDIGANMGLFAIPAALKASRVYAFEPDVELAHNLCRSLRLRANRGLNATVICAAVSNVDGTANFEISKFSRAMNKLEAVGRWRQSTVTVEQIRIVPTLSIDTLANSLAPPTILKIDVESAEMLVLEGGAATIAAHRPSILIECSRRMARILGAFFAMHRYVLLDGKIERPTPLSSPVWDTIAIPEERMPRSQ